VGCGVDVTEEEKLAQFPKRILVVDDEPRTRALIWDILSEEDYDVGLCASGEEALERLARERFDLILADIKMPGMSGLELLSHVRALAPEARVVLITAYASMDTAIVAVRYRAFDYLVKPFDLDEFRRTVHRALDGVGPPTTMQYKDLTIDLQTRWVWVGERKIRLTRLEFNTLAYLFEHRGSTVSSEDLLREAWESEDPSARDVAAVKTCISRLRKKLGDDAEDPTYIFNMWGVGYRLGE
jgi:DNA-binding response OmpR family regulator